MTAMLVIYYTLFLKIAVFRMNIIEDLYEIRFQRKGPALLNGLYNLQATKLENNNKTLNNPPVFAAFFPIEKSQFLVDEE